MLNENDISAFLSSIGVAADASVCFESVSSLCDKGIIFENELKNCKNRIDWFELTNTVTVRVIMDFIEKGVSFLSLDGIIISPFAEIGENTVVHLGTQIRNGVKIGKNSVIGPNTVIENSSVGDGCVVNATQVYSSVLEDNVKIGPFCHVRPNSRLCSGVKIGDFVEVKNSVVGRDSHASHLTYIGDSDVGERVNFGCGTVTSNYDGYKKNRCVIGDDVFVGCNTNLIAPVTVGNGAYIAAGSTITDSIPESSLGIARARQVNKINWSAEYKRKNGK